MLALNLLIATLGLLCMVLFLGAWTEVFLMMLFVPWYFGLGAPARTLSAVVEDGHASGDPAMEAISRVPWLAARKLSPSMILVCRRTTFGPLAFGLPPIWSARFRVDTLVRDGKTMITVELRHGFCWLGWLSIPILGGLVLLLQSPTAWTALFLLLVTAIFGSALAAFVHVARTDTLRVRDLVVNALTTHGAT